MTPDTFDFEQADELARVSHKIATTVLAFCRENREFHGDELCDYVRRTCGGSAESARRVMRDLRTRGLLEYTNVSRSGSIYRVERVS